MTKHRFASNREYRRIKNQIKRLKAQGKNTAKLESRLQYLARVALLGG